jgi:pantoate--beta-alanine ligase
MLIFEQKKLLTNYLNSVLTANTKIGFIPTMGALHAGHLSLMSQSVLQNDITVVSIFVNPTQFNNPNDLEKYPRTLDADVEKIKKMDAAIIIYAPTVADIYEGETLKKQYDFDGLENQMEGKFRAGHFDGVGTIVQKLFEIIKPTTAYFGEKDFQQVMIVKKLVSKNNIPVNIVCCPILREDNGLAMSSRNERLTKQEREEAKIIYETLLIVKQKFKNKNLPVLHLRDWVKRKFDKEPDFVLEYFEIADEETLLPCLKRNHRKSFRAFIAVFVRDIRLIDTIALENLTQ